MNNVTVFQHLNCKFGPFSQNLVLGKEVSLWQKDKEVSISADETPNLQFPVDLVTLAEEILNKKFIFVQCARKVFM